MSPNESGSGREDFDRFVSAEFDRYLRNAALRPTIQINIPDASVPDRLTDAEKCDRFFENMSQPVSQTGSPAAAVFDPIPPNCEFSRWLRGAALRAAKPAPQNGPPTLTAPNPSPPPNTDDGSLSPPKRTQLERVRCLAVRFKSLLSAVGFSIGVLLVTLCYDGPRKVDQGQIAPEVVRHSDQEAVVPSLPPTVEYSRRDARGGSQVQPGRRLPSPKPVIAQRPTPPIFSPPRSASSFGTISVLELPDSPDVNPQDVSPQVVTPPFPIGVESVVAPPRQPPATEKPKGFVIRVLDTLRHPLRRADTGDPAIRHKASDSRK
jgi:hypothetical protein